MLNLKEIFEKYEDEYLEFDKVENKRSKYADLNAFLLLAEIDTPAMSTKDIISASQHDEFWLNVDTEKFAEVATEEQVLELIRCGVRFQDDGFAMFA